jgi:hypothetical protein
MGGGRGWWLAVLIVAIGALPRAGLAEESALGGLGFAKQRIGVASGYGWGFGAFGSEGFWTEKIAVVPLIASWSIGTEPFLDDTWVQGNVELQLEGQLLFETEPRSGFGGGWAFALRYNFLRFGPLYPFFEGGLGVVGIDFDLEQPDGLNFVVQAGGGAHWRIARRFALTLQYRFHHISNADLRKTNPGINTQMVLVGPTFYLR